MEELRMILRKKLRSEVFRVLTRVEMQKVFSNCVGVGSPFLVHDPDTYQVMMLFTAWSDLAGNARELWIGDIDKDLEVRNMKRLATGALFDVAGLNTATAFWDDYNEEWVFACTAYGAPKKSYGYFIFFDKNWNVKRTQVIDFESTFDTTTFTPNLGDAGIGTVPLDNKYLVMTAGFDADRSMWYLSDYTARPLPKPTIGNVYESNRFLLAPTYFTGERDVHQLFVYNRQLIMLSETRHYTQLWGFEVCFGPEKDWGMIGATPMFGKFHMPSATIFPHGLVNYTHMVANVGHPHYTSLLGAPFLFFATFPTWDAKGKRRYAHEIWAVRIKPEEAFDPRKNFPLVACGYNEPYRIGKIPIPTFGAKTATIYIFNASAHGALIVIESSSPLHIWTETTSGYSSRYSISAGNNKLIISSPAPYIALKTDVDVKEWLVVLE
ncbi:MAG: hypothetical protein QXE66_03960 [Desulfurococcaceae archaeon]